MVYIVMTIQSRRINTLLFSSVVRPISFNLSLQLIYLVLGLVLGRVQLLNFVFCKHIYLLRDMASVTVYKATITRFC